MKEELNRLKQSLKNDIKILREELHLTSPIQKQEENFTKQLEIFKSNLLTKEEVHFMCAEAKKNGYRSVCTDLKWVSECKKNLNKTNVTICAQIASANFDEVKTGGLQDLLDEINFEADNMESIVKLRENVLGVDAYVSLPKDALEENLETLANLGVGVILEKEQVASVREKNAEIRIKVKIDTAKHARNLKGTKIEAFCVTDASSFWN